MNINGECYGHFKPNVDYLSYVHYWLNKCLQYDFFRQLAWLREGLFDVFKQEYLTWTFIYVFYFQKFFALQKHICLKGKTSLLRKYIKNKYKLEKNDVKFLKWR